MKSKTTEYRTRRAWLICSAFHGPIKITPELHYSICIYYCSITHRTSNTLTLAEHLKAQRLVKKLEGNKNKGKQAVIDHLIPYPAAVESNAGEIRIRLLDFSELHGVGVCRDSALRDAQDALLRRIITMMKESQPIPSPDQYLEPIDDRLVLMVDPLAIEAA